MSLFLGKRECWYNPYFVTDADRHCSDILFHDGEKVIGSIGRGWIDQQDISGVTLKTVDKLSKAQNYSDPDKKEKSIEKHIKNKEFFYVLTKDSFDKTADVYLYVDGKNVILKDHKIEDEQVKCEYDLSCVVYTHELYTFEINGITVKTDNIIGKKTVGTDNIKEQAKELQQLFYKNSIYINDSDVCKILNCFELKLRDKRLLDEVKGV